MYSDLDMILNMVDNTLIKSIDGHFDRDLMKTKMNKWYLDNPKWLLIKTAYS